MKYLSESSSRTFITMGRMSLGLVMLLIALEVAKSKRLAGFIIPDCQLVRRVELRVSLNQLKLLLLPLTPLSCTCKTRDNPLKDTTSYCRVDVSSAPILSHIGMPL